MTREEMIKEWYTAWSNWNHDNLYGPLYKNTFDAGFLAAIELMEEKRVKALKCIVEECYFELKRHREISATTYSESELEQKCRITLEKIGKWK